MTSNPHCLGSGLRVSPSVERSPLPTSVRMLAIFSVQNVLFFFDDTAPPSIDPTAMLAISGRSRMPDFTALYRFTIWARMGMWTMARNMTKPANTDVPRVHIMTLSVRTCQGNCGRMYRNLRFLDISLCQRTMAIQHRPLMMSMEMVGPLSHVNSLIAASLTINTRSTVQPKMKIVPI